ncbi:MAG TPA: hypothetical protein VEB41_04625 [Burkholderiales bacterium]|nr:hypothetical protein [Burkholderiales bacterium]
MRKRLCMISLLGMVAVCSASAQTPVPERAGKPSTDKMKPASTGGSASAGSSSPEATSPEEASIERERALDERRATDSKQKMKRRPGYKDEVPSPRA